MAESRIGIRPYQSSDLEMCRALWVQLTQRHRELYKDPTVGGEAPGLQFDRHLARVGPAHIWVAEADGQVVGLVGLVVEDDEALVEPIVVASALRCRGIGRALLERVIEEARALGVRYLGVSPVARNAEALSFFYAAGLRLLGKVELFMDLAGATDGVWEAGPELLGLSLSH